MFKKKSEKKEWERERDSRERLGGQLAACQTWRKQGNSAHRIKERYKTPRKNTGEEK